MIRLPVPYFAWWDPRISTEHLHKKAVQFSEDEQTLRNQTGVNRRNLLKGVRENLGYRDVDRCYLQPKEEFRLANQGKLAAQSAALGKDNRKVKLDTQQTPYPSPDEYVERGEGLSQYVGFYRARVPYRF